LALTRSVAGKRIQEIGKNARPERNGGSLCVTMKKARWGGFSLGIGSPEMKALKISAEDFEDPELLIPYPTPKGGPCRSGRSLHQTWGHL
jgi:hypothetical protein